MSDNIQALRAKYSNELIQAFHIVTDGEIYCPVCQTTHEFKKESEEDVKQIQK